ncbi:MAG TPA: zinc-dependent metalloprotease [Propionicimonas sp.]|nr:zinc-dependent metalloprotease [Propionicimonas sp.]HQD95864.1 zinc-dependent metalloprotease [Propionicimonas sp.]
MADEGFDNLPERGGEEEALLRFLAQFGITPGPDGRLDLEGLMTQLQPLMSNLTAQLASFGKSDASGMNWGFTRDVVRKVVGAAGDDPEPTPAQLAAIRDAVALADLWLDEEIAFPRLSAPALAWRRAEWSEQTYSTWQRLVRPVVTQLSLALRGLMTGGTGESKAAEPMLRMALSGMFAAQVGQSLGSLATTVISSGDIGLPLTETPQVALLPTNVAGFAEGLEADPADVLLFLAVRETARQRLFGAVGWLGPQMLALVEHYARDIEIDPEALEQAIESQLNAAMTAGELEQAGSALAGSLFAPRVTDEQRQVLDRLETLLALVEGWVDEVVAQVAGQRMPAAAALTETLRRRRAAGGPAESALKALVGLEMRPRRSRDAANLWAATRAARGGESRDATWDHPDLVPTADDLADPLEFAAQGHRTAAPDDLDAELAKLLSEEGRGEGVSP